MLLIHTPRITPRVDFVFKHIFNRILGLEIGFTSTVEEFISHPGLKMSYGKQPMGNELFVQSSGLLFEQGVEDVAITVRNWEELPCFFSTGEKSTIPFDIFSASFYLLSRYEGYLPHVKDAYGRFPASESLGFRSDFLHQPIVDHWAYKLKKVLASTFPDHTFPTRKPKVHSLIHFEQPYRFIQKGFIRSLAGYWQDLKRFRLRNTVYRSQVLLGFKADPLMVYDWLIASTKNTKEKTTVFFFLSDNPQLSRGFNASRKRFRLLLKQMSDYTEVGVIFSYSALMEAENLKKEKAHLEEIIHKPLTSSLNADFMVKLPDGYRILVEQELERDFTMAYDDTPGFRAGTCTPFLFYDLDYEIKTPLVVHPIAFTTEGFNNRYESDSLQRIYDMYNDVMALNGTFSVFFSSEDFVESKQNDLWRKLFSEKLNTHG